MPEGYKIRLGDGSEIGPMNLQAVRDWHRQGFLEPKSPVLRPGSTRWTTLDQVLEPQAFARSGRAKPATSSVTGARIARATPRPALRDDGGVRPAPARLVSQLPRRPLALILVGAALLVGGGYLGYEYFLAETPRERQVREASTGERRFSDDSLGVHLDLPRGWLIVRKDSGLVPAPPDARVVFAHGRLGAFGFLSAESAPSGVASLDQYLDRFLESRKSAAPGFAASGRSDTKVGGLAARQASSAWGADGARFRERAVVWKDGWVYFAMACWAPEEAGEKASRGTDALLAGFQMKGDLDARVREAVAVVTREVPFLNAPAAELLMARSEARVLEPDQAFRRGLEALTRALPGWKPKEVSELGQLTSAMYAGLPARDRGRLASYIGRVRSGQSTTPQDDKEMGQLMKSGILRLPAAQRQRLQALYEKAVRAAL
jgi:hypothetical protein